MDLQHLDYYYTLPIFYRNLSIQQYQDIAHIQQYDFRVLLFPILHYYVLQIIDIG